MVATSSFSPCRFPPPSAALLRIRDIASWPAVSIAPDLPTVEALRLADREDIHHLLVARERDLVGIACTCDLRNAEGRAPVGSHMSCDVVTVSPQATLLDATQLMDVYGVDCVPSFWRGAWGMVTRGDSVRYGVSSRRACTACGAQHHVRRDPQRSMLDYCLDCLEVTQLHDPLDALYQDLGVVD
jgi:CBS domain-containing protein